MMLKLGSFFESRKLHPTASHLRVAAARWRRNLERPHTAIGIAGPSVEREIPLPQFAATVNPRFDGVFFLDFTFHRSQQKQQMERQVSHKRTQYTTEIDLRATAPSKKLLALEAVVAVPRFPLIFEKASKTWCLKSIEVCKNAHATYECKTKMFCATNPQRNEKIATPCEGACNSMGNDDRSPAPKSYH